MLWWPAPDLNYQWLGGIATYDKNLIKKINQARIELLTFDRTFTEIIKRVYKKNSDNKEAPAEVLPGAQVGE